MPDFPSFMPSFWKLCYQVYQILPAKKLCTTVLSDVAIVIQHFELIKHLNESLDQEKHHKNYLKLQKKFEKVKKNTFLAPKQIVRNSHYSGSQLNMKFQYEL